MTDRESILVNPTAYLILGDVDKSFHLPECECNDCEGWRVRKDRPTHAELRELLSEKEMSASDIVKALLHQIVTQGDGPPAVVTPDGKLWVVTQVSGSYTSCLIHVKPVEEKLT